MNDVRDIYDRIPGVNIAELYDVLGPELTADGQLVLRLMKFITQYGRTCASHTQDFVMREGAARVALLQAQSRWLDDTDNGDNTMTMRMISRVIAEILGNLATELRPAREDKLTALSDPENVQLVVVDDNDTEGGRHEHVASDA